MTDVDPDARDRWVRSARGPLALVNTQQVDQPQTVWPVPGTWAPGVGGLTVTATAADGLVVDGVPVDGTVLAAGDAAVVPSTVVFADGRAGTVASTPGGHALRIWDPDAAAVSRFGRIERFPGSDRWVTAARYRVASVDAAAPVHGQEARGGVTDAAGVVLAVTGHVTVTVAGHAATLTAVRIPPFRGRARLQLIVQDATSALPEDDPGSSYSMGRFLSFDDPGQDADVTLDWNDLVLPPCAFSYQYACPIPPPENRLPVLLSAGERHGVDVDGAVVH